MVSVAVTGVCLATLAACGADAPPPAADAELPAAEWPEATGSPEVMPADPAAVLALAQEGGPEAVVRLLLQWDTAGLRLEGEYADVLSQLYCFVPEQQCLSEEPAWDFAIVVTGYQLDPVYVGTDTAQYVVLFDEIGAVWPDATQDALGSPPETLSVKLLDGKWRVVGVGSQMPPHLSPNGLMRQYRGIQPDSAVLARWLSDLDDVDRL